MKAAVGASSQQTSQQNETTERLALVKSRSKGNISNRSVSQIKNLNQSKSFVVDLSGHGQRMMLKSVCGKPVGRDSKKPKLDENSLLD